MNMPAAVISAGLGAAFLAAELAFYYQPAWINPDYALGVIFSMKHSKARTAVARLLINPQSAEFGTLRTVDAGAAKYVCGAVKAKDKSGHYGEFRDFVYAVATDSARIDDDGVISYRHVAFRTCPVSPDGKQNGVPDGQSIVEKVVPTVVSSAMSTIGAQMPAGGGPGGSLEQQVGHMANQMTGGPLPGSPSGSSGYSGSASSAGSKSRSAGQQQANSSSKAALANEDGWSSDRPPAAWPMFPLDHPLARPASKRTPSQAIAQAKGIEDRWAQSKSGNAKARPSSDEILEACRALLTVSPKDREFPKAWAAFVRLRKIDREAT